MDQNGKPTVNLLEKDSARTNNKLNQQHKRAASWIQAQATHSNIVSLF